MTPRPHVLCCLLAAATVSLGAPASAQVFTVGEKTATADIHTDFKPTRVDLPSQPMTERGRRDLIRNFADEQGFAHRILPLGTTIVLNANGTMLPAGDAYKHLLYKKGSSAGIGDRVVVTALAIKGNRIDVDLNGGPYPPHRIMRHLEISVGGASVGGAPGDLTTRATGCRVEVVFEGGVPEVSGPEMKALLSPIVDFGVKSTDLAYADTLPPRIKGVIDMHEVLVGMNHRMVLASLGQPESKVRESNETEGSYEEWLYGHQPQTVRFVRFVGDRVTQVKVASLGQPVVVRNQDEMGGYQEEQPSHVVVVADGPQTQKQQDGAGQTGAPTLKLPAEAKTPAEMDQGQTERKVQYPVPAKDTPPPTSGPAKPPSFPGPPSGNQPSARQPNSSQPN